MTRSQQRAALLHQCEQAQQRFPDESARAEFDRAMEQLETLDGPHGTEIRSLCRTARLDAAATDAILEQSPTLERARSLILDALVTRQTSVFSQGGGDGYQTEAEPTRLMSEALAARLGGPAPSNGAREFTHMRVVDMARHCLELRGVPTRTLAPHQVIQRALHTTSDFPALLTETGNRILRAGYESYQGGVRRVCRESTARDFRAKSKLMLGEAPELLLVNEHGEVKRGSMAEAKESYSLATYARIFGITRQALVNDDLGAFADLVGRFGRACAEFIASQLATKLTSNPVMADGVALFHATHGNLGTAAVISIDSLGEALLMMRMQKGLNGVTPIDVTPKYLIVPAAIEVLARQFVAQINATKTEDVNPFTADLAPVVDPRLDEVSETAWYLAADSASFDTIEYSFLESEPGPQIESRAGFDVEGMEMKVRLDFGCGVIDHRGLFKNAGL